jgi:hypothetical protein
MRRRLGISEGRTGCGRDEDGAGEEEKRDGDWKRFVRKLDSLGEDSLQGRFSGAGI